MACLRALHATGDPRLLRPEHVPEFPGDPAQRGQMDYAVGPSVHRRTARRIKAESGDETTSDLTCDLRNGSAGRRLRYTLAERSTCD